MTHVPETGAQKIESIYGVSFWRVCHGYNSHTSGLQLKNTIARHIVKLWHVLWDDCSLRDRSIPIQLDCVVIIRRRNPAIYISNKP